MKSSWLILVQLANIIFFLKDLPFFISSDKYLIDPKRHNKAMMHPEWKDKV